MVKSCRLIGNESLSKASKDIFRSNILWFFFLISLFLRRSLCLKNYSLHPSLSCVVVACCCCILLLYVVVAYCCCMLLLHVVVVCCCMAMLLLNQLQNNCKTIFLLRRDQKSQRSHKARGRNN